MNLHEAMLSDLNQVFFNLDEFACVHEINGKKVACIVDDAGSMAQTRSASDFSNVAGIGIIQCDRQVLLHASELIPAPLPGQMLNMDGHEWQVADSGVIENEGLLTLPLNRAF